ncbi:MAG: hypothetical protein WBA97_07370, partial [Actinophytocola sp.]|uniref:hypothetical protein n=1 Tax=Actinophytocola sp. TaxID=1872138 RepID=UPI003C781584
YQRVSKVCVCCGEVTTPGWDQVRADDPRRDVVAGLGSPVRIGADQAPDLHEALEKAKADGMAYVILLTTL